MKAYTTQDEDQKNQDEMETNKPRLLSVLDNCLDILSKTGKRV